MGGLGQPQKPSLKHAHSWLYSMTICMCQKSDPNGSNCPLFCSKPKVYRLFSVTLCTQTNTWASNNYICPSAVDGKWGTNADNLKLHINLSAHSTYFCCTWWCISCPDVYDKCTVFTIANLVTWIKCRINTSGHLDLYSIAYGSSSYTAQQGTQESQTWIRTRNVRRSVGPIYKNLQNLQPFSNVRENVAVNHLWSLAVVTISCSLFCHHGTFSHSTYCWC